MVSANQISKQELASVNRKKYLSDWQTSIDQQQANLNVQKLIDDKKDEEIAQKKEKLHQREEEKKGEKKAKKAKREAEKVEKNNWKIASKAAAADERKNKKGKKASKTS